MKHGKKLTVTKHSPEEEQRLKDEEFLNLEPTERLRINEILRKRIWGKAYNSQKLKGLKSDKISGAVNFFSRDHERLLRKLLVNDVEFVMIGGHASDLSWCL